MPIFETRATFILKMYRKQVWGLATLVAPLYFRYVLCMKVVQILKIGMQVRANFMLINYWREKFVFSDEGRDLATRTH